MVKDPVAKITKVYSGNGELSLRLYDCFFDYVDVKEPLYIEIDSLEVPLYISKLTKRGSSKATVLFDDIDSEIRALEFVDKELYLYFEEEDKDGEFGYEDMVGFTITDSVSGKSGVIQEFVDYGENILFDVDFDSTQVMIPIVEDIIISIDPENREIEAVFPDGLMDLYKEEKS